MCLKFGFKNTKIDSEKPFLCGNNGNSLMKNGNKHNNYSILSL